VTKYQHGFIPVGQKYFPKGLGMQRLNAKRLGLPLRWLLLEVASANIVKVCDFPIAIIVSFCRCIAMNLFSSSNIIFQ
jgi:hypothetical protein